LRWVVPEWTQNRGRIAIVEQQVPGRVEPESEEESTGLPDVWLSNPDADWALLIESKISAHTDSAQLRRHAGTAERVGFRPVRVLLITTEAPRHSLPKRVIAKTWADLYSWFGRRARSSEWADRFVDYLRAAETRLVSEEYLMAGTLTRFDGFHFTEEKPYTAREGRRLIRLMREELIRHRDLRRLIDRERPGRPAITGRGAAPVWDFISLRAARRSRNFTAFPHLTLALHPEFVEAAVTVPNGLHSDFRRRIKHMTNEEFYCTMGQIRDAMATVLRKAPLATPRVRINQRHFLSQNSRSITDGELDLDLRTAFRQRDTRVKYQPQWLDAVFEVLKHRRANIQFQVWLRIPYARNVTDRREVLDIVAAAWLACESLITAIIT
jgi:hypothetical protein